MWVEWFVVDLYYLYIILYGYWIYLYNILLVSGICYLKYIYLLSE